jgi:hypothetical protein
MRRAWLLLFALLSCAAAADELGLSYVETKDARIVYFDWLRDLVPHTARTFTNALAWNRRMFGWTPSEPTTILLKDFSDYASALTIVAPRDLLVLDIAPMSHAFETYPATERMYTLLNHEMNHVAQGDGAGEPERRWRRFFRGKVPPISDSPETLLYTYLTVPRFTVPRWYAEGSATFMETWMAGGLGRAQGGYDEMVFRAMVRDGMHFYDPLGLVSKGTLVDFQITVNAYLYGTRFFTWLAYAHTPEKVVEWLRRDDGGARSYADQFERVFGMSVEEAWRQWIEFEHEFQRRNLAEVRRQPITPHRVLATSAAGSVSRMYYDERDATIFAAFRQQGFIEQVGALDTRTGSVRHLADIKRAMLYRVASLAYDPQTRTVFYTNDNLALRDLMAVDVDTGAQRMLLHDARIGDLVFNRVDRSLWGVRHDLGLASIVRIPYPYTEWTTVHTFPYENVPYDLDVSPDGRLLSASMSDDKADQFVRVWQIDKLLQEDVAPLAEFRFGQSIPESFVFSPDGRYLYGSSYYTGVSNIFRLELGKPDPVAVSNAEIGFFRPVPLADGHLIVLAYTGAGFVPAMIDPKPLEDVSAITFLGHELAEKHPMVTTWQVPAPSGVDYGELVVRQGPYQPLRHVALSNAYPVLQGYKDSVGLGYRFNFEDPILFANFSLVAAYTPTGKLPGEERTHFDLRGEYLGWHGELAWNKSDFYDLFGPTKRSRKGSEVKFGYDWLLIYDEPRKLNLLMDGAYYDRIDTLPNAQNVTTPFTRLVSAEVALKFTDLRRSIGAVDDEKGLAWSLLAQANYANDAIVPQYRGTFDIGLPLPLAHSSVWLRSAAGLARGARNDPLANFYFGGFGNNYVDRGTVQRYQEYRSLPGFGIDEVSAQSFLRELVEWHVPPVVFESLGTPAFYLTWLRPSVFAIGLWTDPGNKSFEKRYASAGAQADLRFTVLHWYEMTLSIGVAAGFEGSRRAGTEWMISLKII